MKLDLDRTPAGASTLPVDDEIALEFTTGAPASVRLRGELRVDQLESRVLVRGELRATGRADCDRCLNPFELRFDVPVDILVFRDEDAPPEAEDGQVLHQRTGELDLHGPLAEAVVLAVPQARVCREACRGLCPHCGIDLNEATCTCADADHDPRWDGLPD